MSGGQPQAKVLLATLTECTSGRGNVYLRGWAGASNLVAFRGEDDDQGRPTWHLYLVERQPREGGQASARRPQEREATSARATEPASAGTRSASFYRAPRRESQTARQERVAAEVAERHGARPGEDFNDEIPVLTTAGRAAGTSEECR